MTARCGFLVPAGPCPAGRAVARPAALRPGQARARPHARPTVAARAAAGADAAPGAPAEDDEDGADPDDDIAQFKRDAPIPDDELELIYAKLNHPSKRVRQKASLTLAANRTDQTISTLIKMLELVDTTHRRQAVQTLGVIGRDAVVPVVDRLLTAENPTLRASCAKAVTAIAANYPEIRVDFPEKGLDGLQQAITGENADPVTKLSTVMALGEVGADNPSTGARGNQRAVDLLLSILKDTEDMGLAATTMGALSGIGIRGDRDRVLPGLKEARDSKAAMEGGEYIVQMATAHITQLESGGGLQGGLSSTIET